MRSDFRHIFKFHITSIRTGYYDPKSKIWHFLWYPVSTCVYYLMRRIRASRFERYPCFWIVPSTSAAFHLWGDGSATEKFVGIWETCGFDGLLFISGRSLICISVVDRVAELICVVNITHSHLRDRNSPSQCVPHTRIPDHTFIGGSTALHSVRWIHPWHTIRRIFPRNSECRCFDGVSMEVMGLVFTDCTGSRLWSAIYHQVVRHGNSVFVVPLAWWMLAINIKEGTLGGENVLTSVDSAQQSATSTSFLAMDDREEQRMLRVLCNATR